MPRQDLRSRLQVQLSQVSGALQEVMFLPEAGKWLPLLEAMRKLMMAIAAVDIEEQEMPVDSAPGEDSSQAAQTLERRYG